MTLNVGSGLISISTDVALAARRRKLGGMSKARRLITSELGPPNDVVSGRCSVCQRPFEGRAIRPEDHASALHELRAQFEQHNCNEDANQAAFRVVREATKE